MLQQTQARGISIAIHLHLPLDKIDGLVTDHLEYISAWITIREISSVEAAHCTCMAGYVLHFCMLVFICHTSDFVYSGYDTI